MKNYWSNSKFADSLRGVNKPEALSAKAWDEWETTVKYKHPIRYWIVEVLLDNIQNFVRWPYERFNDVRYYINNRWVTKSHALTAHPKDIKPGDWQDVGWRFLPCLFNELVDFVEVEQAWHHVLWSNEARKKYNTPWWRTSILKYRKWRCPEAGLDYLDWASSLTNKEWLDENHPDYDKPTPQAVASKEIKELYLWWKNVYPNRPDPYDISGWTEICEKQREAGISIFDHDNETPEQKIERDASLKKLRDIEAQYEQEETEMLIRLIRVRFSLWT